MAYDCLKAQSIIISLLPGEKNINAKRLLVSSRLKGNNHPNKKLFEPSAYEHQKSLPMITIHLSHGNFFRKAMPS